jgi:hypothetical protein
MQASTPCRNKPMRQGDPCAHNQPNGWPSGAQLREPSLKAKRLVGVGRKTRVYRFRAMSRKRRKGPSIAALPLAPRELGLAPRPPMH